MKVMFSGHLRLFEDVLTLGCWIYNFQISKSETSSFFFFSLSFSFFGPLASGRWWNCNSDHAGGALASAQDHVWKHLVLRFPLSYLLTADAATDMAACTYRRSGICDCEHELWPTGGMQSTVILILQNHLITSEYKDKKEHLIGDFFFSVQSGQLLQ